MDFVILKSTNEVPQGVLLCAPDQPGKSKPSILFGGHTPTSYF